MRVVLRVFSNYVNTLARHTLTRVVHFLEERAAYAQYTTDSDITEFEDEKPAPTPTRTRPLSRIELVCARDFPFYDWFPDATGTFAKIVCPTDNGPRIIWAHIHDVAIDEWEVAEPHLIDEVADTIAVDRSDLRRAVLKLCSGH